MPSPAPRSPLELLRTMLARVETSGLARLSPPELRALPQLYRRGASEIARLETSAHDPAALAAARDLVARAHTVLHRDASKPARALPARVLGFLFAESPAAIRAEWKLFATAFALVYGLALIAYVAVASDLELAYALLAPEMVTAEIRQLEATAAGEPFRGNFTFGLGESPLTSGWIMTHNMGVGILFFASGLLPPLFLLLLASNGLMLGTYTAVAGHWDQAGAISSILWCHGVIEIQAIVLAGTAGLVLVRAWVAPGPWTRRHAMRLESARAWRLIAPVFPLLFVAGLIEGFVSPHAPLAVRLATAVGTGVALVLWVALGGRGARAAEPASGTRSAAGAQNA